MEKFKEGMIVQLKSGGPNMTVRDIDPKFGIFCVWFSGNKLETKAFKPDTLKIIKEEQEK